MKLDMPVALLLFTNEYGSSLFKLKCACQKGCVHLYPTADPTDEEITLRTLTEWLKDIGKHPAPEDVRAMYQELVSHAAEI